MPVKNEKIRTVGGILLLLAVIQLLRFGITQLCFLIIGKTLFTDRVACAVAMVLLTGGFVLLCRRRKIPLSVFPAHFGVFYIILTALFLTLLTTTPFITGDSGAKAIFLLLYGAVIVPVFEELLFRGYVWNRLDAVFGKTGVTYVLSAALFAVWHFGYADSLAMRVQSGLAHALFWKAVTGLCFGLVLGLLRIKCKNSYATMLLHGILNIFGR